MSKSKNAGTSSVAASSTPFWRGHCTPSGSGWKGKTFREETFRGKSSAIIVRHKDDNTELKDKILGSTIVEDAIKNYPKVTSSDVAGSMAVLESISAQLSSALDATNSSIKSLCAGGLDEKPLPSIEEMRFDTGPQRLVLNLNQLLDEFGNEETRKAIQKVNPRDLDLCDRLGSLTATMVELTEIAKEINDFNSSKDALRGEPRIE